MKKRKTAKKKGSSTRKGRAASTPATANKGRKPVTALEVAQYIAAAGEQGVAMADLEKKYKIDAHPMRAKIHYIKTNLDGWTVENRDGRYFATGPSKPAA